MDQSCHAIHESTLFWLCQQIVNKSMVTSFFRIQYSYVYFCIMPIKLCDAGSFNRLTMLTRIYAMSSLSWMLLMASWAMSNQRNIEPVWWEHSLSGTRRNTSMNVDIKSHFLKNVDEIKSSSLTLPHTTHIGATNDFILMFPIYLGSG